MRAYNGNNKYIFISYAHKDEKIVYPIILALQEYFNVWYDEGIRVGDDYRNNIMNHLKYSSLFLFFVSSNSLNSDFCKKEIHFAESKGIRFINILIEDLTLPDWFEFDYGHLQHFPFYKYKDTKEAIHELVRKKQEWFTLTKCDDFDSLYKSFESVFGVIEKDLSLPIYEEKKEVNVLDEKLGIIPKFSEDKKTVTYGLYPQNYIPQSNEDLLKELNALPKSQIDKRNGWYLYNGEYYVKVVATPYTDSCYVNPWNGSRFNNGASIIRNKEYWFKCEPIVWDVIHINKNEYLLFSQSLLDYRAFFPEWKKVRKVNGQDVHPNNYEFSNVRAWLNGLDGTSYDVPNYKGKGFIDFAFALNDKYLKTQKVDNSLSTTGETKTTYICNNTEDKAFLISYEEFTNYVEESIRPCKVTEYGRTLGASYRTGWERKLLGRDEDFSSGYLTRSPQSYRNVDVRGVTFKGEFENYGVLFYAVRPCIVLKMSDDMDNKQ